MHVHNFQVPYRHGRLADHTLMYAVDTIAQAVDAGDHVCAAFLDLKKALEQCILLIRAQK